ncbi:hypothetical protein [Kitasatospora sp. HPMI-4]|uniref:hypothetical protein n=1 Tax=Kitasatospora sp. HPMI-4 TaxID=3448443 RepID=UPI003F1A2B20
MAGSEADQTDFARRLVQRRAQGKSPEQIEAGRWEAQVWEREAGRMEDSGLRPMWEAAEWERIAALVGAEGWAVYDVALDGQAQAWITEREVLLAAERKWAERVRREQQEAAERVLCLSLAGPVGRRLEALARELGVMPERLVAVLVEHVQGGGEGLVHVPAVAVAAEENPWL